MSLGRTAYRLLSIALLGGSPLAASQGAASSADITCDGQTTPDAADAGRCASELSNLLREALQNRPVADGLDMASLRRVYQKRDYVPLWTGSRASEADARHILGTLQQAAAEGLRPQDYRVQQLSAVNRATGAERVKFELLLTDAVLRYARDVYAGRIRPESIDRNIKLTRRGFDFEGALLSAAARDRLATILADLAPKNVQYVRLRDALARYRAMEDPGQESSARIHQIAANMERWRWVPREFEARYIEVNVADATLKLVDHGTTILESKVIIGKPGWDTPITRVDARGVIVNPVWHVPPPIARREILPKLGGSPGAHGWRMVDGQLQQLPGPRNALGRFKFDMPNDFDVYLHDTPGKALFAHDQRALSHGCIRVQQIAPLVAMALYGDFESGKAALGRLIASNRTTRVAFDRPLPIYLFYWTAIVDENGQVQFHKDIYGRDRALTVAMEGGAVKPRPKLGVGV